MANASAAEIRAWAKEQDIPLLERGNLTLAARQAYADAHPGPGPESGPGGQDDGAGDDGGSIAADDPPEDRARQDYEDRDAAADAAAAEAAAAEGTGPAAGRPRAPRPPRQGARIRDKLFGGGAATAPAAGKAKARGRSAGTARARAKARARVSLAPLATRGYGLLAKGARAVNVPLSRVLTLQAPTAGMIAEDAMRGTLVDRLLQPLARAEGQGEAVYALLGPPLLVMAMQMYPDQAGLLAPMLRDALGAWREVAGVKEAEMAAEAARFEEDHGTAVDELIMTFFAGIPGFDPAAGPRPGTPERAQWEAKQAEHARHANGGPPPGAQVAPGILVPAFTPPPAAAPAAP